jgi:hypothetical protein
MREAILHVIDQTTPADAVGILAALMGTPQVHHVAVVGHRNSLHLLRMAGMDVGSVTMVPSRGWMDPTGWRGVRRIIGCPAAAPPPPPGGGGDGAV